MTHGLSATELAQMRDDLDDLLSDSCNILSLTRTSDGAGGWSETWGTATASVACRVDHKTAKEQLASGELRTYQTTMMTLAYDKTITTANRVEIASNTYAVTGVNYSQSWIATKRVNLELL